MRYTQTVKSVAIFAKQKYAPLLPAGELGVSTIKMKKINELKLLYSDFLFGEHNYEQLKQWGFDRISNNEDQNDENILFLISSDDITDCIDFVKKIIKKHDSLASIEISRDTLITKINNLFTEKNIPKKITHYKENDPNDYDGEGQSVTDFFIGKSWKDVELKYGGGYLLTYLTPEAFYYYLPSFLMFILKEEHSTTDLNERFFEVFEEESEFWKEKMLKLISFLTCEQKKVVLATLRFKSGNCHLACRNARKLLKC